MTTERVFVAFNPFGQLCSAQRGSVHAQPALHQAPYFLTCNDDIPNKQTKDPAGPVTKLWRNADDEPFQTQ